VLEDVGLGYITLGQSAVTLSGGEAQRVKLATELAKRDTGKTFYILDEPTTGLHFEDIHHLLEVLNKLVDRGNTVLVIEHNMDVIKVADHIIDIGPEGGGGGGMVLFEGRPEDRKKAYRTVPERRVVKAKRYEVLKKFKNIIPALLRSDCFCTAWTFEKVAPRCRE
jgi:excinuclease UvrABC ATPase subunit